MELLIRSRPDADLRLRTDDSMRARRRLRLIMLAGSCIIIGMATRFGEIAFTLKSKAALKQINRLDSFILNNEAQPPKENVVFCGSKRSHNYDLSTRVHQSERKIQCDAVLNLFTTCIEATQDSRKSRAQLEVLRSYQRLKNLRVQAWLFTESEQLALQATKFGVHVHRKFERTIEGTPCLSYMYNYIANVTQSHCKNQTERIIFDAYSNCDIIFTKGLIDTLHEINRKWKDSVIMGVRKGVMVVGKRTNVEFHDESLMDDIDVQKLSRKGKLFYHFAQDYFVYSRGARDWNQMPHFVVGRRAYDNWLVTNAHVDDNMDLIDGTKTILALHLTSADGNSAGHVKLVDNDHNVHAFNPVTKNSVGPHEWNHGSTDDAHFFTVLKNGTVFVLKRAHKAGSRSTPVESFGGQARPLRELNLLKADD